MPTKLCACCGLLFQLIPQVPNQTYCSAPACQRARRQRWNQQKLISDPDYRENKQRTQRVWMDKHPDYWRQYRDSNPEYADRNRSRKRTKVSAPKLNILAKRDESNPPHSPLAGVYRITPVPSESALKTGTWIVELTPVCLGRDCPKDVCKGDACKDRT